MAALKIVFMDAAQIALVFASLTAISLIFISIFISPAYIAVELFGVGGWAYGANIVVLFVGIGVLVWFDDARMRAKANNT